MKKRSIVEIFDDIADDYRNIVKKYGDYRRNPEPWQDFVRKWGYSPHTVRKWISGSGLETRVPRSVAESMRRISMAADSAASVGRTYRMSPSRLRQLTSEITTAARQAVKQGLPRDLAMRGVTMVSAAGQEKYIKRFRSKDMLAKWLRRSTMPLPAAEVWQDENGWWYFRIAPTGRSPA